MNKAHVIKSIGKIQKEYEIKELDVATSLFWIDYLCKLINRSEHKNKFILKGGFLVSSIFGWENRTTKDIDLSYNGKSSENEIEKIFKDLSTLAKEDDIIMNVHAKKQRVIDLGNSDKRLTKLCAKLKILFKTNDSNPTRAPRIDYVIIDLAEPEDINTTNRDFISIASEDKFTLQVYTVETIMAEKIHAMWSVYKSNRPPTRARDWFDLGFFNLYKKNLFNYESLLESINKTFTWRGDKFNIDEFNQSIDYVIKNDGIKYFSIIAKKSKTKISFDTVIDSLKDLSNNLAKFINK